MNKKLIVMSLASVIVSANQECLAEVIIITAKDVKKVHIYSENDNTITLKGINLNAPQLKNKLIEGNTIKLTIPEKIDGKQVVLAPKAFRNLDMEGASLELKFDGKVKLPSDCSEMFASTYDNESPITFIDFGDVDTSGVTTMNRMFGRCGNLTSLDLRNFNTGRVWDMRDMFNGCTNLNSVNVRSFNTENVENIYRMFGNCVNLKSLDLSSFNIQQVEDVFNMFGDCNNLTSLKVNTDYFNNEALSRLPNGVNIIDVASLARKRNALNQIYWRIVANNAIVQADPDGEHSWITNTDKYWKSIVEVIGKAIGDCVTKQNEFANPTEDGLIVFEGTEPEDYEPEHWNAVFLYNFVYQIVTKSNTLSTEQLLDDVIAKLSKHYTSPDASSNLNDELDRAKRDIIEYDSALRLRDRLNEYNECCRQYESHQKSRGLVYLAPRLCRNILTEDNFEQFVDINVDINYLAFATNITIEKNNKQKTVFHPYLYGYGAKLIIPEVEFFHLNRIPDVPSYWSIDYKIPDDPSHWRMDFKSFKIYNTMEEISENCGPLKKLFGDLVEFYDE